MPRKPTGNPQGRPKGTGTLGEQTRFTVRIPTLLYDRLEAFAAGRHFHRGTPQLAGCVRDALAEYLDRHSKRQTEKRTAPASEARTETEEEKRQTENEARASQQTGRNKRQTKRDTRGIEQPPLATRASIRQPRNPHADLAPRQEDHGDSKRQTENTVPAFDTTRYVLGELCTHGHAYHGTGQALRRLSDHECLECHRERMRAYRERKRQAQPA